MAKLVVLRGDTIDRKIDLVQLPARIGRGPNNAVVLQDPMKGVSREHAEIRLVDGRYILVDLGSENGIWVAGRRVPEVVLDPSVIASIGPFRLMLAEEATVPDTEIIKQMQRPAAVAVPPVSKPAAPKPAAPTPAAPQPAARKTAAPPSDTAISNRTWLLGGGLAAAALVIVLVVVFWPDSETVQPIETVSKPDVAARIADARRQISDGLCAEAVQTIDLTLQDYPNHADLLEEKRRAQQECMPREEIGPPVLDVVAELRHAQGLLDSRECRGASLVVANVLIHEPENPDAAALKSKVDQCMAPPPPPPTPTGPRLAQEEPPEQGGLPVKPGELETDYRKRVAVMRVRYDEAIAALGTAPNPDAIAQLESLLAETSQQYLDVAARLADAKRAMAKLRQREAQDLERKEQYDDAIAKLNEAKAFDPSLARSVDNEVARIQKTKIARGEEACKSARADIGYAQMRNEALDNFRRVVRWLPPDHPCYADARKYVTAK